MYALRNLEGGALFSGPRMRLGSQKVPHMWYPRTREKQQNVFWGAIPHITMACVSNISFSDNFVQKKISLSYSRNLCQNIKYSMDSTCLSANSLGCLLSKMGSFVFVFCYFGILWPSKP